MRHAMHQQPRLQRSCRGPGRTCRRRRSTRNPQMRNPRGPERAEPGEPGETPEKSTPLSTRRQAARGAPPEGPLPRHQRPRWHPRRRLRLRKRAGTSELKVDPEKVGNTPRDVFRACLPFCRRPRVTDGKTDVSSHPNELSARNVKTELANHGRVPQTLFPSRRYVK